MKEQLFNRVGYIRDLVDIIGQISDRKQHLEIS